ncbi:MAG: M48 family metallopeptidase [Pseudomonadota bacterium]
MNFFDQQDQARRKTKGLVGLFFLAVVCIVLAVDAVVLIILAGMESSETGMPRPFWETIQENPLLIVWSSLIVLATIGGATLFKLAVLRGGGGVVARSMGGTLVSPDATGPKRRQLCNVVEEIALASGVPVPEVYVLEAESGINAFAAGYAPGDAAVAVSRGCLETLTRNELQGVIAHEFSHIFNGDMRLNIRLMGVLFGILVIGLAGRQILRATRHGGSRKDGAPLLVAGGSLMIIGYVGLFFGHLIQAAVSRQREFLADASAVQFTRDPTGIGGALKKIAAVSNHGLLEAADPEEVSHMLFADGLGRKMFATHPPLEERIRAIDPQFDMKEIRELSARIALEPPPMDAGPMEDAPAGAMGFAGAAGMAVAADTADLMAEIGNPSWDHVAYAELLIDNIPELLLERARSVQHAVDVVLALLLDKEPAMRAQQLEVIASGMGPNHRERVEENLKDTDPLPPLHRLPLVELAFPAVKRRPRQAIRTYLAVIGKLIRSDGEVTVFEYALSKVITQYLEESIAPDTADTGGRSLKQCRKQIEALLSVLADKGHDDPALARQAYTAGMSHLFSMNPADYQPPDNWVAALDESLGRVDELRPMFKQALIEAAITTLAHDGQITLEEVELLRAMCAALHCPMPPRLTARAA